MAISSENRGRFLTIKMVARELGKCERSVMRLIADEQIVSHGFGGSTRIERAELEAYIARSRRRKHPGRGSEARPG